MSNTHKACNKLTSSIITLINKFFTVNIFLIKTKFFLIFFRNVGKFDIFDL